MEKMKFIYSKENRNFGFIVEEATPEKCFDTGIDKIIKEEGELLDYYSIDEYGQRTYTPI